MRLVCSAILLCLLCFFVAKGEIVVAADGSGDFKTVQQAVDHVPDNNNQPVVIYIKRGVYQEQVRVTAGKRYLTFHGEDPTNTVLTYRLSALQAGNTRLAFSTLINANDFRAENLTFENSFGVGSQAVALFVDADRASFKNCRFLGWQDTLFVNGSRHYFKDCYIEGHVDFIFGTASAVFEDCTIHSKGQGYVAAHYRLSNEEDTGFVFVRCRLTGANTGNGVYLGRPWRPYARTLFIDCWLGSHIRAEGWDNWRDPAREKTAWFAEYKSKGPGANPSARVAWSRQLTATEARSFRASVFSVVLFAGSPGMRTKQSARSRGSMRRTSRTNGMGVRKHCASQTTSFFINAALAAGPRISTWPSHSAIRAVLLCYAIRRKLIPQSTTVRRTHSYCFWRASLLLNIRTRIVNRF